MEDFTSGLSYEYCALVPQLPYTLHRGLLHIIQIHTVTESGADDLDIQDVIITILALHSRIFLANFLNLDIPTASFYYKPGTPVPGLMSIIIVRDGDMVECGFYEEVDGYRHWDCRVIYTILPHGEWIPEYAFSAGRHYFSAPAVKDIAAALGFAMLLNKPWVAGKGVEVTHYFED